MCMCISSLGSTLTHVSQYIRPALPPPCYTVILYLLGSYISYSAATALTLRELQKEESEDEYKTKT